MANHTHQVPRVICEVPMWLTLPADAPIPVRMRDDLDPYNPPAEHSNGYISWSGYATREARDTARAERADQEQRDRAWAERDRVTRRARAEQRIRAAIGEAMRNCDHLHAVEDDDVACYMGPVAVPPYTEENRAAHGNIQVTDRCPCGAARARLINGRHEEVGPWGIDDEAVQARAAREVR